MKKTVLFIDGQNFPNKVEDVLRAEGLLKKGEFDKLRFDYTRLFDRVLSGFQVDEKRFYAAKVKWHKDTPKKSQQLIETQRLLKTTLEHENFQFIVAGTVRANYTEDSRTGRKTLVFKEKGVDVRIATDSIGLACDGKLNTAILCSSDSDLQPAVTQLKSRGVEVVYVGFGILPNRGLVATTDRSVLVRNSEVRECYTK